MGNTYMTHTNAEKTKWGPISFRIVFFCCRFSVPSFDRIQPEIQDNEEIMK